MLPKNALLRPSTGQRSHVLLSPRQSYASAQLPEISAAAAQWHPAQIKDSCLRPLLQRCKMCCPAEDQAQLEHQQPDPGQRQPLHAGGLLQIWSWLQSVAGFTLGFRLFFLCSCNLQALQAQHRL